LAQGRRESRHVQPGSAEQNIEVQPDATRQGHTREPDLLDPTGWPGEGTSVSLIDTHCA
jgi:hypothetical protein